MRILYHHRTRGEDAQGIHIGAIVKAFRDLGHEVDVVGPVAVGARAGARPAPASRLGRPSSPAVYELLTMAYNVYGYAALARRIRAARPEMIYERYALNTFCGVWASRRFGIPIVVEVNAPLQRELQELGQLAFPRLAARSERWICASATRTVVVSEVLRGMLAELGVPPERMTVVRNGIDPSEYGPAVSGDAVRERYGLRDHVVLGCVGWFRKWHGVEMLLQAFHEGGFATRRVKLLLVGDGPAVPELRERVEAYGLREGVVFCGAVSRQETPRHVAALDVALQPSATAYASPMKIFEYMGMGRCIVAPDQPNVREVLQHGATACLFEPGDAGSLRRALEGVVADAAARRRLGEAAHRALLASRYLWSENARRVLDLAGVERGGGAARRPVHAMTPTVGS